MKKPWLLIPSAHAPLVRRINSFLADPGSLIPGMNTCMRQPFAADFHGAGMGNGIIDDLPENHGLRKMVMKMLDQRKLQTSENFPGIGFLDVSGTITFQEDPLYEWAFDLYDQRHIHAAIDSARRNSELKAVVISYHTPGGYSTAVDDTADAIAKFSKSIPVLSYVPAMAASAGYWLAAAGRQIHAAPNADVGSIGVYSAIVDDTEYFSKQGLKVEYVRDGQYKAMNAPGKAWTDEEKALVEGQVMATSKAFKGFVRKHRSGIDDATMQGQTFTAKEAPAGLVDSTRYSTTPDFLRAVTRIARNA